MKNLKLQLIIGFVALGVALLGVSYYFSKNPKKLGGFESRLASLTVDSGDAFVFRAGVATREVIDKKTPLYSLDSVETAEGGTAILTTENGDNIVVLPNSYLTLEKTEIQTEENDESTLTLFVKRGDIRVEAASTAGDVIIAKNGQSLKAREYTNSQLAKEKTQAEPALDTFSNPITDEALGLSETEIKGVLNGQRQSFFKCYTQLLQKEPTARGEVALSFTIEASGKLSIAEVSTSSIDNRNFKDCLLEVLKRVEFKPFKGTPISTLFPLKFE